MPAIKLFSVQLLLIASLALSACSGVTNAYRAADTLEETAYVITEHFSVLNVEARELVESGFVDDQTADALRSARDRAIPLVTRLRDMSQAYNDVRSAENQQALQDALNLAVPVVSDFLNALREAR